MPITAIRCSACGGSSGSFTGCQEACRQLFDANIFHPHPRTLAYSDATLLQGIVAAPWLFANLNPVLVYNVLLLAGIASSGVGMFVLVRHLTGNPDAALVSAAIFTLTPYRVEHFMHLELQWTVWMPLTLWAVHRVFETGSRRLGVLAGAFLALQVLSSMYYGAFLGIMVAALAAMLAISEPRRVPAAVVPLGIAALLAGLVAFVYAQPYMVNARTLGVRDAGEVSRFSAQLASYVTAPAQNWLWGWTSNHFVFEGDELHLFPGLAAVALAVYALTRTPRRLTSIYLVMTIDRRRAVARAQYAGVPLALRPCLGARRIPRARPLRDPGLLRPGRSRGVRLRPPPAGGRSARARSACCLSPCSPPWESSSARCRCTSGTCHVRCRTSTSS